MTSFSLLLGLPAEVRLMIYECVVDLVFAADEEDRCDVQKLWRGHSRSKGALDILRVCRRVSLEFSKVFFRLVRVDLICRNWGRDGSALCIDPWVPPVVRIRLQSLGVHGDLVEWNDLEDYGTNEDTEEVGRRHGRRTRQQLVSLLKLLGRFRSLRRYAVVISPPRYVMPTSPPRLWSWKEEGLVEWLRTVVSTGSRWSGVRIASSSSQIFLRWGCGDWDEVPNFRGRMGPHFKELAEYMDGALGVGRAGQVMVRGTKPKKAFGPELDDARGCLLSDKDAIIT